jgi:hypothetical protein
MGATKQLMMETEELQQIAVGVLCDAGVLKACEWHGDVYGAGTDDLQPAYRIANARVTAGEIELPGDFTRHDLTDAIKHQGEMYWNDSCPRCDKLAAE